MPGNSQVWLHSLQRLYGIYMSWALALKHRNMTWSTAKGAQSRCDSQETSDLMPLWSWRFDCINSLEILLKGRKVICAPTQPSFCCLQGCLLNPPEPCYKSHIQNNLIRISREKETQKLVFLQFYKKSSRSWIPIPCSSEHPVAYCYPCVVPVKLGSQHWILFVQKSQTP